MPPRALRNGAARIDLAVQALCFAAGALNHGRDFPIRGWQPYRFAAYPAFELYWSALILLDLAVVVLLLTGGIRPALLLGLGVMVSDVAINVIETHGMGVVTYGWPLLLQAMFLGFILGSIGFLWDTWRMSGHHQPQTSPPDFDPGLTRLGDLAGHDCNDPVKRKPFPTPRNPANLPLPLSQPAPRPHFNATPRTKCARV